ncbi:MAG TPA: alpha/beta hydrolase [Methylomirabilota bacterium]|jgi:pimeloyl-ACP methyl ester carboxylesterase|nr:alpha/beta hydrolase [Methylomirabilota bacterium]
MADVPETRYAKSGDTHIAYQVIGSGPLDVVWVPGFVSHVEAQWQNPAQARMMRRLASFSRLIVFDKPGTGMSDRFEAIPTLVWSLAIAISTSSRRRHSARPTPMSCRRDVRGLSRQRAFQFLTSALKSCKPVEGGPTMEEVRKGR